MNDLEASPSTEPLLVTLVVRPEERDRKQTTAVHILAADIIRKELVPKV